MSSLNALLCTACPLINAPSTYFTLKLSGAALIEWQCLKDGGTYFTVKRIIPMRFQKLLIFSFEAAINNFHYDIWSHIFQNDWLFSFFHSLYSCSMCLLI